MRTVAAAIAILGGYILAECPNACSGHGTCGSNDMCNCFDNWIAADCSERVCPFGLSWADSARGDLNHDGQIVSDYSGYTSPANYHFRDADKRYNNLVDAPLGYYMTQWSNKIEYEYFPLLEGSQDATTSDQLGFFEGADNENLGGVGKARSGEAHFYAECSNRGSCDRSSGVCSCFDGFQGSSCQRATCPNDCSGHGSCLNLRDIAQGTPLSTRGRNYRAVSYYNSYTSFTGVDTAFEYNLWDADKQQACVCDKGYFGPDCSQRECPRGADPLTVSKYHCGNSPCTSELQAIHIRHPTSAEGVFTRLAYVDVYGDGVTVIYSEPFLMLPGRPAQTYADQVQIALQSFPNNVVAGVNVTVSNFYDGSTSAVVGAYPENQRLSTAGDVVELRVDFRYGPQGDVNALQIVQYYPNGGAPSTPLQYNSWALDSSGSKASSSTGGDNRPNYLGGSAELVPKDGNRPNTICSGRGLCDFNNGECQCFSGYTGVNCGQQNALAA